MIIYLEMIEVDYRNYRRLYPIHKDDNTDAYYIDGMCRRINNFHYLV